VQHQGVISPVGNDLEAVADLRVVIDLKEVNLVALVITLQHKELEITLSMQFLARKLIEQYSKVE
jgi:hypothetical protein